MTDTFQDEDAVSVIDYETFNGVKECDDDPAFIESIVDDYLEQLKLKTKELHELHEKGELQAFSQVAHFLKSSSATLGVAKMRALFGKLQVFAQEGKYKDKSKVDALVPKVDKLMAESTAALKAEIELAKKAAS